MKRCQPQDVSWRLLSCRASERASLSSSCRMHATTCSGLSSTAAWVNRRCEGAGSADDHARNRTRFWCGVHGLHPPPHSGANAGRSPTDPDGDRWLDRHRECRFAPQSRTEVRQPRVPRRDGHVLGIQINTGTDAQASMKARHRSIQAHHPLMSVARSERRIASSPPGRPVRLHDSHSASTQPVGARTPQCRCKFPKQHWRYMAICCGVGGAERAGAPSRTNKP